MILLVAAPLEFKFSFASSNNYDIYILLIATILICFEIGTYANTTH